MLDGWEYAIPAFLRKKRSKIFMADDPMPGAMNKIFRLEVDQRFLIPSSFTLFAGLSDDHIYARVKIIRGQTRRNTE